MRHAQVLAALTERDAAVVVSLIAFAVGQHANPPDFLLSKSRDSLLGQ